jgi:integrase
MSDTVNPGVEDDTVSSLSEIMSASRQSSTLSDVCKLFLASSPYAQRTRQSYAEDLDPFVSAFGYQTIAALSIEHVQQFLARQEHLAPATYNRRLAAIRSFCHWLGTHGWVSGDLQSWQSAVDALPRHRQVPRVPRVLERSEVVAVLLHITNRRDRAFFWLIYDAALRCREALSINLEDINWEERSISILSSKGGQPREILFSRTVARALERYLAVRGHPTTGPLFITRRKSLSPERAELTPDGYARLSYRQATHLWKQYTPGWNVHQLRHTAIRVRWGQHIHTSQS